MFTLQKMVNLYKRSIFWQHKDTICYPNSGCIPTKLHKWIAFNTYRHVTGCPLNPVNIKARISFRVFTEMRDTNRYTIARKSLSYNFVHACAHVDSTTEDLPQTTYQQNIGLKTISYQTVVHAVAYTSDNNLRARHILGHPSLLILASKHQWFGGELEFVSGMTFIRQWPSKQFNSIFMIDAHFMYYLSLDVIID